MSKRYIDEIGNKHGHLKVISYFGLDKNRVAIWLCKCKCGTIKPIAGTVLRSGLVVSCGCFAKEQAKWSNYKHGGYKTPECKIFYGIRQRCNNPNATAYKYYGGRGIKCEWLTFGSFYKDMGSRPSKDYSIERKDTNGNYCKSNCIWLPKNEQNNNTSRNVMIDYRGKSMNLAQLSKLSKVNYSTLKHRIFKLGLTSENAVVSSSLQEKPIKYKGRSKSLAQWSAILGINYGTLRKRLKLNWPVKRAFEMPINKKFSTKKVMKRAHTPE